MTNNNNQSSYYTSEILQGSIDIIDYVVENWSLLIFRINVQNSDIYYSHSSHYDREFINEDVIIDGEFIMESAHDHQGFVIIGSNNTTGYREILQGFDHVDALYGLGGKDYVFGQGGLDILSGGDGNDILDGGSGDDTLVGGQGNHRLLGGHGDNLIYVDEISARVEDNVTDIVDGGAGDDEIHLSVKTDYVYKALDPESGLDTVYNVNFNNGPDVILFDTATIDDSPGSGLVLQYRDAETEEQQSGWVNEFELLDSDTVEIRYMLTYFDSADRIGREHVRDSMGVQFMLERDDVPNMNQYILFNRDTLLNTQDGIEWASQLGYQIHDFQTPETFADYDSLQLL